MSDLKFSEKDAFERLLDMGGGYVADFSNRTFDAFFRDFDIDIYQDKYGENGNSKANRLRSFWQIEKNATVGNAMREMVAYTKYNSENQDLVEQCEAIVSRLLGEEINQKQSKEQKFLSENFELNLTRLDIDAGLKSVLDQRLEEIGKCFNSDASLSVILLCGSSLEGLLLNQASKKPESFNRAKSSPKTKDGTIRPFNEWSLSDFISVAYECRYIKKDVKDFSHSLRNFRNYIHPHHQMVEGFFPDNHTAEIAWQVLKAAIADLSGLRE